MIGCMSAGDVIRLTRLGRFTMNGTPGGAIGLLKRLRGGTKHGASSGAKQMKMLRRLPQILRFIPGPAQDVRAYFLTLQYWLAGSEENVVNMVRFLIDRYADGPRRSLARHAAPGRASRVSRERPLSSAHRGPHHGQDRETAGARRTVAAPLESW